VKVTHPYDPETVVLGVVGRPHGVAGEVWLRPHNTQGRSFEGLRELLLVRDGVTKTHAIVSLRSTPDGALARLEGVTTREAASALTLAEVRVRRDVLAPLGPGEFYVDDAIGCAVAHESGRALGVVASTFWNGAHDVMVIAGPGEPATEVLIPLVPRFVVTMDAPGRKIVVSWDGNSDVDDG
jgi:16S rRNA processing protein RimM